MASQLTVSAVQTLFLLIFALGAFGVPVVGNLILVIWLMLFAGLTGMAFGMVLSIRAHDAGSATQVCVV